MDKKRIAITVDRDVLDFIDSLAAIARVERSTFINQHFSQMMPAPIKPSKPGKARPLAE